jgi:hypothetical protein
MQKVSNKLFAGFQGKALSSASSSQLMGGDTSVDKDTYYTNSHGTDCSSEPGANTWGDTYQTAAEYDTPPAKSR